MFYSVNITTILVDSNAAFKNEVMLYLGTDKGSVLRVKPRKNMVSYLHSNKNRLKIN